MAHAVTLRKVGGSVMLALPRALLDLIELAPGQQVAVSLDRGRIVVEPKCRTRYSLGELLALCDPTTPLSEADTEWLEAPAAGQELL